MKILRVISWSWRFFKRKSWKMRIILLVVLGIVGFLVFNAVAGGDQKPQYEVEAAKLDTVIETVTETGNVSGTGVTPIYSTTTGVIEELHVQNGSFVEKDKPLFSVKSTSTKQEKDSALAAYLLAKNNLEAAKNTQLSLQAKMLGEWDEFKTLAEGDDYETTDGVPKHDQRSSAEFHVSNDEWLAAEGAYKNQQQVISQASVNSSAAWQAYQSTQDSQVIAVLGGIVENLSVTRGSQIIASSAGTTTSSPVLLLVDRTVPTTVQIEVSETDAVKIEPGQKVAIDFDAIQNKTFEGSVDRVDFVAAPNQGVVNYNVYLFLTESDPRIRKGMTANVTITVAEKQNVLTVPSSAVKPHEGGRAVRVVGEDGEMTYMPVTIGSRGDEKTEILSGINEGQEVIVALENDQIQRQSGGFFGN